MRGPREFRATGRKASIDECSSFVVPEVNRAGVAPAELRGGYQKLNESFSRSFAFRCGRGVGFCAEIGGLIKCMMRCLHGRIRLCASHGGRPTGIATARGLTDYFVPLFPEVEIGILNLLNRPTYPGAGRFRWARQAASRVLHTTTGIDLFMMDDLGPLPDGFTIPELGIDLRYWDACAYLSRLLWTYRPEIRDDVFATVSRLGLPDSYVSVHLRRGDKKTESPYASVEAYAAALIRARPGGCVLAVASDDGDAIRRLASCLPAVFEVISCSDPNAKGYVQGDFNSLSATVRFALVKRFLAEFEALRGGEVFVGSATSNVTYLVQMMRAGQRVLRID